MDALFAKAQKINLRILLDKKPEDSMLTEEERERLKRLCGDPLSPSSQSVATKEEEFTDVTLMSNDQAEARIREIDRQLQALIPADEWVSKVGILSPDPSPNPDPTPSTSRSSTSEADMAANALSASDKDDAEAKRQQREHEAKMKEIDTKLKALQSAREGGRQAVVQRDQIEKVVADASQKVDSKNLIEANAIAMLLESIKSRPARKHPLGMSSAKIPLASLCVAEVGKLMRSTTDTKVFESVMIQHQVDGTALLRIQMRDLQAMDVGTPRQQRACLKLISSARHDCVQKSPLGAISLATPRVSVGRYDGTSVYDREFHRATDRLITSAKLNAHADASSPIKSDESNETDVDRLIKKLSKSKKKRVTARQTVSELRNRGRQKFTVMKGPKIKSPPLKK